MSIDTGASGNLFAGKYFNAEDHQAGKLKTVITDFSKLEANNKGDGRNYILKINPKEQ